MWGLTARVLASSVDGALEAPRPRIRRLAVRRTLWAPLISSTASRAAVHSKGP